MNSITLQTAHAWYSDTDPVHDFAHIERVYHMATRLALAEGADLEIVQTAALLHDAEGSAPGSDNTASRANHHLSSADFARAILEKESWPQDRLEAVLHCIRAHRFRSGREEPQTLEAKVLFDADKLDVLGAVGVARTIAYAVLDGQPVYAPVSDRFVRTGQKEPGEPHSSYHEFIFKLRKVKSRLYTTSAKKVARSRHQYLERYYKRLISEMNAEA
jgi:uncharacterized protein